MKAKKLLGMISIVALFFATVVYATVTFDPSTGFGFVGKGDVQLALGLNNAQMQAQAGSLVFKYVESVSAEVTYVWGTGSPEQPWSLGSQNHNHTTTTGVDSTIAYDARKRNQVNGFNLNGLDDASTTTGDIPEVDNVVWITFVWDAVLNRQGHVTREAGTSDAVPAYADEDGNPILDANGDPILFTASNKAVLSVVISNSAAVLSVNDVPLLWPVPTL